MFQAKYFNFENIFYQVYLFLKWIGLVDQVDGKIVFSGQRYVFYIELLFIFISVFLTFMIIDFLHRLFIVRREEEAETLEKILNNLPAEEAKNERWSMIEELISLPSESDWKLAIIEADKMLDDLLSSLGYKGATIGDKLQVIEKGDMQSLDDAWEAHKYRNKIAHETGFTVTLHEAKNMIGRYANVFREYHYI